MPDPDKKKHEDPAVQDLSIPDDDGVIRDESELYGDEADIPVRRKKAGRKADGKGDKPKIKVPGAKKKTKKSKKKSARKRRVRRSIFDLMSATGSDSLVKPLRIFGREIRFWPLFLLGIIAFLAVGVMLNNSNISVNEQTVTIVGLPEELENYRIIVMSDMNGRRFGDTQSLLLRTINNHGYDAIICLGDMVGKGGDPEPFYEFLDGLRYPDRVYFICGDSDPGPFVRSPRQITGTLSQIVLEDWILGAIERGAHYVDAPAQVPLKNARLWLSPVTMLNLETVSTVEFWKDQAAQEEDGVISGVSSDYQTLPMTDYRYQQMQKLYDAQREMGVTDIQIGLAHEPPSEEFIYISTTHEPLTDRYLLTPELILAGHFCNGVWRLPFIGAFYVPDETLEHGGWWPRQSEIHGLSSVDDTQMYITGGMSSNGSVKLMPFRLFNSPEISALTLTSTLPENMLEAG
ncbi:MAG: metallophosphoesterase [Clostridia bacterium]|nr:metallophosphoesterase [Clostridia bacterium]